MQVDAKIYGFQKSNLTTSNQFWSKVYLCLRMSTSISSSERVFNCLVIEDQLSRGREKKIVFKANLAFSIFTMWQMISVADISLRLVLSLLVLFVQLWGCDCIIDVSYGSGLKRKEWSLRKVQTYLQIYLFTQRK